MYRSPLDFDLRPPMEIRMIQHGLAGRIQGQAAYDTIHKLVALRRATGMHRLLDPVELWLDCLPLRPSEKIEGRRAQVLVAKRRCVDAGIALDVVDNIFPEHPIIVGPRASKLARLRDEAGYRFALWRERRRHAANM